MSFSRINDKMTVVSEWIDCILSPLRVGGLLLVSWCMTWVGTYVGWYQAVQPLVGESAMSGIQHLESRQLLLKKKVPQYMIALP